MDRKTEQQVAEYARKIREHLSDHASQYDALVTRAEKLKAHILGEAPYVAPTEAEGLAMRVKELEDETVRQKEEIGAYQEVLQTLLSKHLQQLEEMFEKERQRRADLEKQIATLTTENKALHHQSWELKGMVESMMAAMRHSLHDEDGLESERNVYISMLEEDNKVLATLLADTPVK